MAHDNDPAIELCKVCGAEMELVQCWCCHGTGGFHDCGEDTCCCIDPEEITEFCDECEGEGSYLECAALPHTTTTKG